jgi:hypothetical protein
MKLAAESRGSTNALMTSRPLCGHVQTVGHFGKEGETCVCGVVIYRFKYF